MEDQLTKQVIGAAIDIHRELGPGLLESAYQSCLAYELRLRGFKVQQELKLPIVYTELELEQGYRIDLLVNEELIIEIKTVESLNKIHQAQLLTYLRFSGHKIGLLINFNERLLTNGIKRMIL